MALSNPRSFFGVHSVTPYNTSTKEYYGTLKVLGSSSLNFSGELVALNGGSSKFPYHVEDGLITAEIALTFREYPDFVFELFLGKAVTTTSAQTSGSVTALANGKGTSVLQASTGIASVGLKSGSSADVKFAQYVVKAASTTTVDVYAATDIDFARGTDATYQNDLLKITATALTITASTAVEIPGTGLELTGGSGTIGMTAGDTAYFSSKPINSASVDVVIGGGSDSFPEFGAIVLAKQRGNGQMAEFDLYRCKAVGLPIGLEENTWSEASVTAQAFFDSTRDGVFSMRTADAV